MTPADILRAAHVQIGNNYRAACAAAHSAALTYARTAGELRARAIEGKRIPASLYRDMLLAQQDLHVAEDGMRTARAHLDWLGSVAADMASRPGEWEMDETDDGRMRIRPVGEVTS